MPCYSCVPYVTVFGMSFVAILTTLFLVFHMSSRSVDTESSATQYQYADDNPAWAAEYLSDVLDQYGYPTGEWCIATLFSLYDRLTPLNTAIFLLKYIPSGLYMYRMLKSLYVTSRERIKQKQLELEDIKLQIQIVNTKLYVRDAEFEERAQQLKRCAERLRAVRGRVRELMSADDILRRILDRVPQQAVDMDSTLKPPEEESQFIIELLTELNGDSEIEQKMPEKLDCSLSQLEDSGSGNSVYSSLSDSDTRHDCRVKIVKVTNVYKVSCLKHYIKQKKLRRATQQALLEKKIKNIKKLLESWQKSLNTVINSKLLLDSVPANIPSPEPMEYPKQIRESSDSDSDLKTGGSDHAFYDEYSMNWAQNPYRPYVYNYEDISESTMVKEYYDQQMCQEMKLPSHAAHMCDCNSPKCGPNLLFILPEETSSQMAIEVKSDTSGDADSDAVVKEIS